MFDGSYYDRLARLTLTVSKKSNASLLGSRKSVRKGSSAEFSGFREYMPGDDVRSIDWNAYARLDRLYIKEYMEEKESRVHIFLDTSRSMDYGERKKSELAKELAAALSYISLMHMDQVVLYDLADLNRSHRARGGKSGFRDLTFFLERLGVSDRLSVYPAIRTVGRMQPGLSVILSDFLEEDYVDENETLSEMLKYLEFQKQNVILLQILAKEEREITLTGTCNLIDAEAPGEKLRVTMDREAITAYGEELKRFQGHLARTAKLYGAAFHICDTGMPFDKIIFEELRDIYD